MDTGDVIDKKEAIEKFRYMIETFSEFWIGCTAVEIGILEIINKNGKLTTRKIAESMGWDETTIESLCNCLVSYNYLGKRDDRYALSKFSEKYLLRDSGDYLGFFLESARVFDVFSQFTDHIVNKERLSLPGDVWKPITRISALIGEGVSGILCERFPFLRHHPCKILDLGCGRMHQSIQLAKANPSLTAIGVESNRDVIDRVNDDLMSMNLTDRVRIIQKDIEEFDTTMRFDMIFLNHILHCLPHETNVGILNKSRGWLEKNGYVVIFEDLLNDDRITPKESVKKNLLARVFDSKIYSVSELRELLLDVGFVDADHIPMGRRIIAFGRK